MRKFAPCSLQKLPEWIDSPRQTNHLRIMHACVQYIVYTNEVLFCLFLIFPTQRTSIRIFSTLKKIKRKTSKPHLTESIECTATKNGLVIIDNLYDEKVWRLMDAVATMMKSYKVLGDKNKETNAVRQFRGDEGDVAKQGGFSW